jgi:NAD(P)-dependent dehydrogenase (short-subunit alcohol dehydrogenase family)
MKKIMNVGASSGIGQAIAKKLIAKDISVISISRSKPALSVSEHVTYDVRSNDELPLLEGAIHGIVYCPGSINLKPFKNLKLPDFQNDFDINVLGAVKIIQKYLPNLIASQNASIVLFSTIAVQTGMPFHSSVAISKGAIEGLGRTLAAELSPKIRVNVIAPSLVKTPLTARLTDTEPKVSAASERHPLKRVGETEDIAGLANFLLSDEASWITGQVMHADGGMSTVRV